MLYLYSPDQPEVYARLLRQALPDIPVVCSPEAVDADAVTHAAVWGAPPGFFLPFRNLRVVFNLGAGIDGLGGGGGQTLQRGLQALGRADYRRCQGWRGARRAERGPKLGQGAGQAGKAAHLRAQPGFRIRQRLAVLHLAEAAGGQGKVHGTLGQRHHAPGIEHRFLLHARQGGVEPVEAEQGPAFHQQDGPEHRPRHHQQATAQSPRRRKAAAGG